MKRLIAAIALASMCIAVSGQHRIKPGTVPGAKTSAFDCYRSFLRQPETTALFADRLGIVNRCFFVSNTINSLGEYYCEYPPVWLNPGKYDWSNFDAQADDLIKASPNGRFICMIDLNTPYWAIRRYRMDSYDYISHFGCSPKWMEETGVWLDAFLEYSEKKYGERIFAYILSCGGTSEWLDQDINYSSRMKNEGWIRWCRERNLDYGPETPSMNRLSSPSFEGLIFNPEKEADLIEYTKFVHSKVSEPLLYFAERARGLIPEDKLLGAFYGYYYSGWIAHLDYRRVLSSPYLDFFVAPGSYSHREVGWASEQQIPTGSVMINGKRFLHEIDFRPHGYKHGFSHIDQVWRDTADDVAGNLREGCYALVNHADLWWFDMWGHFYDGKTVQQAIGRMHEIYERFKDDDSPSVARILNIADPESLCYMHSLDSRTYGIAGGVRDQLGLTGMPYCSYSFNDLERLDLSQFKVIVLPATMVITPEKERILKDLVCRDGRTVVWCYGPGICDGKTVNPDFVKKWAGVPFRTEGISTTCMGEWTAVYAPASSAYNKDNLREICLKAGVHPFVDETIPVVANERLLSIHCKEGGVKTVHLEKKAKEVIELISGKVVARNAKDFRYEFRSPDTALFELVY